MIHRKIATGAALLAAAVLSGCASAHDGALDTQPSTPSPTCRVHQTAEPGSRYSAGPGATTRSVLELMRYYTANGTKTFCDGKPPTDTDKRWTDLYTELGGERRHVAG